VIGRSLLPGLLKQSRGERYWREVGAFWIRRIYRILPSAWLWIAIMIACTFCFNHSGAFKSFWPNFADAIAGMLHVANFHHYAQMHGEAEWGANSVYWSLSLEEQFYIALPLLVLVSQRRLNTVLILLVLLQLFLPREQGSLLWELRTDALLLGVLIAQFSLSSTYRVFEPVVMRKKLVRPALIWLALIALIAVPSTTLTIAPFYTGMLAIVSVLLVWLASYDRGYVMATGRLKSTLLWVGKRSFAIYLIHVLAYRATNEIWFRIEPVGTQFNATYTLRFFLTAVLLMALLAELNYRFVETPLRRIGAKKAQWVKISSLAP
jgi:peptidoglycan/LPS O-acetylase OafA/YrhL